MIVTEVKTFERSSREAGSNAEAQKLLANDIHLYIAFFKDGLHDVNVSTSNYKEAQHRTFCAMVVLRHKKSTSNEAW